MNSSFEYNPEPLSSSQQLLRVLQQARTQLEEMERKKTEPIAIIGVGFRFPGGVKDPETFWRLLHSGVDAITEIPSQRWDVDRYYDPDPDAPGKIYTRYGGFLDEVDKFDAQLFGIAPREAVGIDPQQRLLLEVTWEALENAGLAPERLKGTQTGVFVGMSSDDYSHLSVNFDDLTSIDTYTGLGNGRSIAVGRLAYTLGLQGLTMQLDTSCSSSLLAMHLACQSLRSGECNLALAGGVNLMLSPITTILFCKTRALSPDGRCKTFDAAADGYARGEGGGIVVLKRLSDAIADGDNILALIRGSAANHDGRSNGLTAPNGSAQEVLLQQALKNARVKPEQIQYVEAHGTGTSLGDPIEVLALGKVLGQGRWSHESLMIGSLKSNFGHLEAAAGVASLIKVVLSLQHQQIPPHLHFKNPNPYIPWDKMPIVVPTELTPWSARDGQRLAGVSCFGMSGTNVHLILSAAPEQSREAEKPDVWERALHILTLSAKSEQALQDLAQRYQEFLGNHSTASIGDVCFTANTGRSHFDHRLALVAQSNVQLCQQLSAILAGTQTTGVVRSQLTTKKRTKIAFLFTGQGSQYVGMGQQLYETQPTFRKILEECDAILRPYLNEPLLSILYPELAEPPGEVLDQPAYSQPALFALEYALFQLWISWGVEPDVVMGHGVGEYVAATAAGIFSLEDGLKLIATRGRLMQLPFTSEMEPMLAFEAVAKSVTYEQPRYPVISNITGQKALDEMLNPQYWVNHVRQPMRFAESIATLDVGIDVFLEIGPQPILLEMGRQCLADAGVWLPSMRPGVEEWQQMLSSLGQLYAQGVAVDWSGFDKDYTRSKVVLPTYPFQRQRYWVENNHKTHKRTALPGDENLHPLLGKRLHLPFAQQIRFESQLGIDCPPHQEHHRLFGINIIAAASHISLVLLAVREGFETQACTLEELSFQKALVLPEEELHTVQVIFDPENPTKSNFEIISLSAGEENQDASWVKHVTGSVRVGQGSPKDAIAPEDLENIQQRCQQIVTGTQVYNQLYEAGYTLGTAFRWIGQVWQGEGEALGRMELPELPDKISDYQLYPGLIDSCFQVLGMCRGLNELETLDKKNFIFIPFYIQSFQFFQQPKGNQLWCHALRSDRGNAKEGSLVGDLLIFDEVGNIVAKVTSFEARIASREVLRRSLQPDLSDWYYQQEWIVSSHATSSHSSTETGRWLIFAPATGLAEQLIQTLHMQGHQCILVRPAQTYQQLDQHHYQLCPTQPADFQRLLQSVLNEQPLKGIVHLWSLDTSIEALSNAQELSCGSVLHLLQALVSTQRANLPPIWLVTSGVHQIDNDTVPVQLQQAPLWGLGRAIAVEHPELTCRCLDLEPWADEEQLVKVMLEELLSPDREDLIAYRQGIRQVLRLNRARLEANTPVSIASEGSYLITGGLGALGLEVAQWMVQQGARHLVLTGRREPSPTARQTIEQLEKTGAQVSVLLGDISQQQDVANILAKISALAPLRGVIHAAGILDDGVLQQMSWERFTKVTAPKVKGAWHLHQLTQHLELDFFVCFSSVASLLGSPGQGNYAAANAFMDALAHHRQAMGLPGLSINWGPWTQSGMAARLGSQHQSRLLTQGIASISPDRGLQALAELLTQPTAQISVFPVDWVRFIQQFEGKGLPPVLSKIAALVQLPQKQINPIHELIEQLKLVNQPRRLYLLISYLTDVIAKIMGLERKSLPDPRKGFFDMGMDSLMALDLTKHLQLDLGISLSSTAAFEYSNIEELAVYLEKILPHSPELEESKQPDKIIDSTTLFSEFSQITGDELDKLIEEELGQLESNLGSEISL